MEVNGGIFQDMEARNLTQMNGGSRLGSLIALLGLATLAATVAVSEYRRFLSSQKSPALVSEEEVPDKILEIVKTQSYSFMPESGLVPDKKTAVRIAIAVWENIYGLDTIEQEKPFKATLSDGVWFVRGNLPKGEMGGVLEAQICQRDARIIRVLHSM